MISRWFGGAERGEEGGSWLEKIANRHSEIFRFAFLNEKKKKGFWDVFVLFQASVLKIFFFSKILPGAILLWTMESITWPFIYI